jgi:hypothetical protein
LSEWTAAFSRRIPGTQPQLTGLTTGQVLNTPVDAGAPPKSAAEASKKAAPGPTMGEALHTPVDKREPPKEMQEASKKAAAAAPTMGEAVAYPRRQRAVVTSRSRLE